MGALLLLFFSREVIGQRQTRDIPLESTLLFRLSDFSFFFHISRDMQRFACELRLSPAFPRWLNVPDPLQRGFDTEQGHFRIPNDYKGKPPSFSFPSASLVLLPFIAL